MMSYTELIWRLNSAGGFEIALCLPLAAAIYESPLQSPDTGGGCWRFCWGRVEMQLGAESDGAGVVEHGTPEAGIKHI